MPKVTFVTHEGERHEVQADEAQTLMRAATDNGVPGIDGDCGGMCACGTCHVYIDPSWSAHLPPVSEMEIGMLDFANERRDTSRLACQIPVTAALDGIEVHMPAGQH